MERSTIHMIKTFIMGLGIINIFFGFAMSAYFELAGKIMISSGVGLIAIYFLIYIWQLPETPKPANTSQKEST